jgi:thiamine pyrophosphokinase
MGGGSCIGGIMHAIIVANGPMPQPAIHRWTFSENDRVICVDGGVMNALSLGLKPDVVVGDLDSLDVSVRKRLQEEGCLFIQHPSRKDETDSELAIRYALSQGANELTILAALGGRIDHALANVMLLALPELANIKARLIEGAQEVLLIRDQAVIEGVPGDIVSLLPLTADASGVHTEGLEYALHDGTLKFGAARGVSNVLTAPQARVRLAKGLLLAVHHHRPPSAHNQEDLNGGDNG